MFESAEGVVDVCVPLKVGEARGALRARAEAWVVETGLFTSEVLSTFVRPTAILSSVTKFLSPRQYCDVVPAVMVGSLVARALACADETGLFASAILSTFAKPTAVLSSVTKLLSPRQYCAVVPTEIDGSLVARALACADETGLFASAICQWRRQIVPDGGVKVYQSG